MKRARDPLLAAAAAATLLVAALGVESSLRWIGRPFAGFLVLENRVIASAGLARWPATRDGAIYQHEVTAVEGEPLADVASLAARVASHPPGTALRYELRRGDAVQTVAIETRRFEKSDWMLLFGSYLLCGLALCGIALCVRFLRGGDLMAQGTSLALYAIGMWALTAIDLYGPYRLFRAHALFETAIAPAAFVLALVFPKPLQALAERAWLRWLPWLAVAPLAVVYQAGLHDPDLYRTAHGAAQSAFGLALLALIAAQVAHWARARDFLVRQRVKVVALGSVLALGPQVVVALFALATGVHAPQNLMAYTGLFFPLSIAYAVLRHNLLEVDEFLRRALNYALLTAGVVGVYAGAVALSERLLDRSPIVSLLLGPVSVLVLLPLRDRAQGAIDRVFFRQAYDFRRVVETASARLASVADLSVITLELQRAVGETLAPEWTAFYVRRTDGDGLVCLDSSCPDEGVASALLARASAARHPCDGGDGALAVPFLADGSLVAALLLGRRLSGRLYGGDDRRLLHTLANQGAVAIENALALEQLRDLNRDLEGKVAERTSELRSALHELREAQAALVHREKMASIGQFVAGVAHEMNNPLAFIEGNLHFLRSYAASLAGAIDGYEKAAGERPELRERLRALREEHDLDHVLADLGAVLDGCAEGVERTSSLVRDLRTFSRLDHADVMAVDLREAIDSTLNLLRSRLAGIEVVRQYQEAPLVECLAGQLNQVFMNLLANAADATPEGGRVTVRVSPAGERVAVEIEDTGRGIPPEHLERIFEPFFTTKEPGQGTGLGLAISYGIVARHRGALSVRSEPGRGSCFRLELPVRADLVAEADALKAPD
jgi:signal transduction histidine kinase